MGVMIYCITLGKADKLWHTGQSRIFASVSSVRGWTRWEQSLIVREYVHAMANNLLGHVLGQQWVIAPVWFAQKQLRHRRLCGQCE